MEAPLTVHRRRGLGPRDASVTDESKRSQASDVIRTVPLLRFAWGTPRHDGRVLNEV